MPEDDGGKARKGGYLSFWTTLPGILTGVAAVITAVVGLATLLHSGKPSMESAAVTTASTETQLAPATVTTGATETAQTTTAAGDGGGILARGRLSLRRGDEADLESGVIEVSSSTDLSFGPESTPWLHGGGGDSFFAPVPAAPTKAGCVSALTQRHDQFEELPDLGTGWVCVSTSEGDVAAVEIVALPGVGNPELRLAYTVWR
jgi:hypothetical protein